MKAVITVIGKDSVGILAVVATTLAESGINIEEVTQSILAGTFAMIMVVDLGGCSEAFESVQKKLSKTGLEKGVEIKMTRSELYETMHRI